MESPLYREIYQEGVQEGLVKGRLEMAQAYIIEFLHTKFDLSYAAIKQLEEQIKPINNLPTLHKLIVEAAKAQNFSDFVDMLNGLEV